ncbi:MAG TPA: AAA family ATPase, partial [Thermoflexia bacterium]|nr:AAA family ATPase [Thermoflexia bacterium]
MKFPYGISDFHKLITEDYFYVDRTAYIRTVEEVGPVLLFLRPRRFGKSLWLSTLENYYDVAKADEFESLFGQLAIGQEPTPWHNQYLIMRWNFSAVDPSGDYDQIRQSLFNHVNGCVEQFIAQYQGGLEHEIVLGEDALRSFRSVLTAVQRSPYRLYLLIDEYDNFANEVLTADTARYESLVRGAGVLKTLFKAAKEGTGGLGLDRIFITGVTPVVMSDITSGFNIAEDLFLKPALNTLCGFTEAEVRTVLQQVAEECDLHSKQAAAALEMLRTFYNGYRFSYQASELVYNPTLVLYFLKQFQETCAYPEEMLDSNLEMDRHELEYVAQLPHGGQLIMAALSASPALSVRQLSQRFGVQRMLFAKKDTSFAVALLYYLGVLTLAGRTKSGRHALRIPNLVVRRLYAEQLRELLLPDVTRDEIETVAEGLYTTGDLQPLCDFVEQTYFRVFSNRDYRWANELTVKTAFLSLLFNDILYIMDSEPELQRGYADLVMLIRPDMRRFEVLDLLLEFK